jgi:mono/diheme cytochrome c family protein
MKRTLPLIAAAAALVTAALSCSGPGARRDTPVTEEFHPSSPEADRGQIAFMQNCHQCHPNGGAGLGPAINNKPVPKWLIETQIHEGLGAMPAFHHNRLSDQDAHAIATYLKELRQMPVR